MKNKILNTVALFLTITSVAFTQQDPKAKKILEELSEVTNRSQSIEATFKTSIIDNGKDLNDGRGGKIITSGEMYHLYFDDMEIISDGESVWTVLADAEEVQLSDVPEDGDVDDYANPTKIATIWERGFNYQFEKDDVLNGKNVHVINLYPQNPDEKDFHTIKLYINRDENTLAKIIIKGKGGTDVVYAIDSFDFNPEIKENTFKYSPSEHPEFEMIDLR